MPNEDFDHDSINIMAKCFTLERNDVLDYIPCPGSFATNLIKVEGGPSVLISVPLWTQFDKSKRITHASIEPFSSGYRLAQDRKDSGYAIVLIRMPSRSIEKVRLSSSGFYCQVLSCGVSECLISLPAGHRAFLQLCGRKSWIPFLPSEKAPSFTVEFDGQAVRLCSDNGSCIDF